MSRKAVGELYDMAKDARAGIAVSLWETDHYCQLIAARVCRKIVDASRPLEQKINHDVIIGSVSYLDATSAEASCWPRPICR